MLEGFTTLPPNYSAMKTKLSIITTLIVLAAATSGCGGSGAGYPTQSEVQQDVPSSATGSSSDTGAQTDTGKPGKPPKVSGSLKQKPVIAQPNGDPPSKLVIKDIKKGSGKAAKNGDKVTVNYVGLNWSDGKEFDTSWGKQPFSFDLGAGGVIKGWDQGVKGMRVGGRRELIIPPELGYGQAGQGASIPPNETLVFVVDLTKVK
jgi:peptidylprolyl isomerase